MGADMTENIGNAVLDFYRTLPFNYFSSIEKQAESIRKKNSLSQRTSITKVIQDGMQILDLGCGAGWLSNTLAYYHNVKVTGIDFNPVAVSRAREVAAVLGNDVEFLVANVFTYMPDQEFDLVCSEGVLHHTGDCHRAIRHACRELVCDGGYFYLGLYHSYGRKPFLDYFQGLGKEQDSEAVLFKKFAELMSADVDEMHLRSWFRDQVLHPHETQHTLKEIQPILQEEGMTLIETSINRFEPIENLQELFEYEKEYEKIGRQRLKEKKYFPGLFNLLCQKNS